jgi:hypothetical protein
MKGQLQAFDLQELLEAVHPSRDRCCLFVAAERREWS